MDEHIIWNGKRVFRGKTTVLEVESTIKEKKVYNWEKPDEMINIHVFSMCGTLYEGTNRDERTERCCGQIVDSIDPEDYGHDKAVVMTLIHLWRHWHLNDMYPGDKTQTEALTKFYKIKKVPAFKWRYEDSVAFLKLVDLIEHDGYEYGTKWLGKPLGRGVEETVKNILSEEV